MANDQLKIGNGSPLDKSAQKIFDWTQAKDPEGDTNTNTGGLVARFVKYWSETYPEFFKDTRVLDQKPYPKAP